MTIKLFKINPLSSRVIKITFDLEDFIDANKLSYSFVRSNTGLDELYINKYRAFVHIGIMKPPQGMVVDHINRDHYDNRKSNLRICTKSQNQMNRGKQRGDYTSKYKGVSYSKDSYSRPKNWACELRAKGHKKKRARFFTEREAALQYNQWALELHGEFAVLNVVDDE